MTATAADRDRPPPPGPPDDSAGSADSAGGGLPPPDFEALTHAQDIVQASGTSFLAAMKILPEDRRNAMFAIYAFCREVDDIADAAAPASEKIGRLQIWRREIERVYRGDPQIMTLRALVRPVRQFGLEKADFLAVIEGMEMDAIEDIRGPSLAALDTYCDRVASAVGRLSIRAFGAGEERARRVAHHLGRALQLTNILRDLDEDARRGRLYLPAELLAAQGLESRDPYTVLGHPALPAICAEVARMAGQHYRMALQHMRKCRRGPMRPARMMMMGYRAILAALERRGWQRYAEPVSLSRPRKLWIAVRYGLI
ncbi:MAG: presqualene diphosphate synthase HpnD [Rhodospirillaceae bacterium]|nr:presqualene diphosphate synthase HpnD [Rhodospirillaceae bacterium]